MAMISDKLNKILSAVFGKDVRQALHDGLEAVNNETIAATNLSETTKERQDLLDSKFDEQIKNMTLQDPSSAEIVAMRTNNNGVTYETAGKRVAELESHLEEKVNKVTGETLTPNKYTNDDKNKVSIIPTLAPKTYVDTKVATISSGTPLFASSVSGMTDTTKNYVNTTDGYLYTYNGATFIKSSVKYQEMGVANKGINIEKLDNRVLDFTFDNNLLEIAWEIGTLDSSTGSNMSNNKRLRTKDFLVINDYTIEFFNNLSSKFIVYRYNKDNNNYIDNTGFILDSFRDITSEYMYKIVLSYADDRELVSTDVSLLPSEVRFLTKKSNSTNKKIDDLKYLFDNKKFLDLDLEVGSINSANGTNIASTSRIRTKTFLSDSIKVVEFNLYENIKYQVYKYSIDGAYIGSTGFINNATHILQDGFLYKLVFAYNDNRNIDVSLISYFSNNTTLYGKDKIDYKNPYLKKFLRLDYEIGSLNSADGSISVRNDRIRTVKFIPSRDYEITFEKQSNVKYLIMAYSKVGLTPFVGSSGFITDYKYKLSKEYIYKIVVAYKDDRNVTSDNIDYLKESIKISYEELQDSNKDFYFGHEVELSFYPQVSLSDFTMVGDELWAFGTSNDENIDYGDIKIFTLDFNTKTASLINTIKHNLGHCNTVDYCKETDTIILGNGSASYDLQGKIILVPNISTLKNNEQININENCIIIDCSQYNLGTKFNLVWGESNKSQFNIAYLITDDTSNIRRIMLGKGANNLGLGQFINGKNNSEFNGTFKILDEYHQETDGYPECIQGGDFHRGVVYTGIGHDGLWYWKNKLNVDGTITKESYRENMYNADGTLYYSKMGGVCINDDYLMLGVGDIYIFKK